MNILVLTRFFPFTGKEKRTNNTKVVAGFVKEWVSSGHNVIVIVNSSIFPRLYYSVACFFKNQILKYYDMSQFPELQWSRDFYYSENGANVYNFPMLKYYPASSYSRKKYEVQRDKILKVLEDNNFVPDVITGHWVNPQLRLITMLKPYFPNAKTALVFHGDYTVDKIKKYSVCRYIGDVDHVGFRSSSAADYAGEYIELDGKSFICPSGVPDSFIERKFTGIKHFDNPVTLLYAGRLLKLKNIDKTIMAAQESFGSNFKMTIVGDGPYKDDLLRLIEINGLKDRIQLIEKVSRERVQELMKECQVFPLISKETFGLVYIEAMLQGCIVVASKRYGVDGIVKDGINGFLCEEGDQRELVNVFNKIKDLTQERLQKISSNAVITASAFSESSMARLYLSNIVS